jgi:predicted RNA-binding protein with PIN domain
MRYKVQRAVQYAVVDSEAAEDAQTKIHYLGPDRDSADQMAKDMNENHEAAQVALQRIQEEAMEQHILELSERGKGADKG